MKAYTQETKNEVYKLYNEKVSTANIADRLGMGLTTVQRWLKSKGILKNLSETKSIYTLNDNYFSVIDTEDKAYFLGLMFADGNIGINGNTYLIRLTSKDLDVLEIFVKCIESDRRIYTEFHNKFKKYCYKIVLSSKVMYEDLNNLGCIPNKSLTLEFPKNIPNNLTHHFIRGYFDGDGTVGFYENKRLISGFAGTSKFLLTLLNYLPRKDKNLYKADNIFLLTFSTKDSLNLYKYMYQDATIYFNRKKNIFENYIKQKSSTTTISNPTII